ncbi:hypothetical protein D3Z42_08200, partial [Lachnospiraceae bacterium]|nr:hypothetical protein [Lachnospiraceae bacterium]
QKSTLYYYGATNGAIQAAQHLGAYDTTKKSPPPERSPPTFKPEPKTNHQTQHSERTGTSIWN